MRPVGVVRIVAEAARTAPLLGTVVSPLLNRGRDHRDGDVIATRRASTTNTVQSAYHPAPSLRLSHRQSRRSQTGKNTHGAAVNDVVMAMLAVLPTNLDDPLERLAASHTATAAAKRQYAAIPQGLVDEVTEFLPPALAARAARVVFSMGLPHRISPFNW
jgi:hypothetical protein